MEYIAQHHSHVIPVEEIRPSIIYYVTTHCLISTPNRHKHTKFQTTILYTPTYHLSPRTPTTNQPITHPPTPQRSTIQHHLPHPTSHQPPPARIHLKTKQKTQKTRKRHIIGNKEIVLLNTITVQKSGKPTPLPPALQQRLTV
jgi:hypothetical protein